MLEPCTSCSPRHGMEGVAHGDQDKVGSGSRRWSGKTGVGWMELTVCAKQAAACRIFVIWTGTLTKDRQRMLASGDAWHTPLERGGALSQCRLVNSVSRQQDSHDHVCWRIGHAHMHACCGPVPGCACAWRLAADRCGCAWIRWGI